MRIFKKVIIVDQVKYCLRSRISKKAYESEINKREKWKVKKRNYKKG